MARLYAVDLDQLAASVTDLGRLENGCEEALDLVRARVGALHGSWSGRAADAQEQAQQRWEAGFREMQAALRQMRRAADVAESTYRAAVAANVRMWSL